MDNAIALLAADISGHKLAMAHAIVYATARHHAANLLTCDSHFEGSPGVTLFAKSGQT